jgi:3D (Asp-Asp-Asp) domain-containing protein
MELLIIAFKLFTAAAGHLDETPKEQDAWTSGYIITAYTAGEESTGKKPGDPLYGVTASGKMVEEGTTIACPKEIPFTTRITIKGIGERTCFDRGSAITGKRLDLYIPRLQDALQFGKQEAEIKMELTVNIIGFDTKTGEAIGNVAGQQIRLDPFTTDLYTWDEREKLIGEKTFEVIFHKGVFLPIKEVKEEKVWGAFRQKLIGKRV